MNILFDKIRSTRIWALFIKELHQIKRNRRLVFQLIIPPTVQLLVFGFALNPEVSELRFGVVDYSRTSQSRNLISSFTESNTFKLSSYYNSTSGLENIISSGGLDVGLVIPPDFARQIERGQTAEVQIIIDGVNSNTATIARGYASGVVNSFNQRVSMRSVASSASDGRITLLYNPGLVNSWFIVSAMLGVLLVLNGSLIASASMVREKEAGTIEQLLMTPATASEVIIAKMLPLFLLLALDIALGLTVAWLAFDAPVRGSILLLFLAGLLCVCAGIGLGTFLSTFSKTQQQAQLMGFFVNPPLALLSGAMTPIEGMPEWLQPVTYLNPVSHYAIIARGISLKAVGIEVLYLNLLALFLIAFVLIGISAWRFRKQLG